MKRTGIMLILSICILTATLTGSSHTNLTSAQTTEDGHFRFGVNYFSTHLHYEPYYLQDEELDRDFSLFREQGFEYVTFAAIWAHLEPSMGTYDEVAIDELIRVCNFASKYDLKVIIEFYTMMTKDGYWTMPTWLSPREFETVFTTTTARQSWLDFLDHCANRLNEVPIWSWHMMNEPARLSWGSDVSIDAYLQLWTEMKVVFKSYSNRPVSIRFAAQVFDSQLHFNHDPRIYELCDYLALNWYEPHCSRETLTRIVSEAPSQSWIMISEFGSNATNSKVQTEEYQSILDFFLDLGITDCIAWMWRADHNHPNPDPPNAGFNLAQDVNGTPRPAFYLLGQLPPEMPPQNPFPTPYLPSIPSATPTPSPLPHPEPSPLPSSSPEPSPSSTPSATPEPPSSIPSPEPSPLPSPTPEPSSSPQPTFAPTETSFQTEGSPKPLFYVSALGVLLLALIIWPIRNGPLRRPKTQSSSS